MPITQLLKQADLVASASEAQRLVEQGGVRVNGERISDKALRFAPGDEVLVQVGKRKVAKVRLVDTGKSGS
jgi:tyrosyl-tRNA synthetase